MKMPLDLAAARRVRQTQLLAQQAALEAAAKALAESPALGTPELSDIFDLIITRLNTIYSQLAPVPLPEPAPPDLADVPRTAGSDDADLPF